MAANLYMHHVLLLYSITTGRWPNVALMLSQRRRHTQQTQDIEPVLIKWWSSVCDASQPLKQHLSCCFFLGNHCPPSFFSSHLTFARNIAGPFFVGSFWTRPLRPTQFSLGEIGAKLYRFSDRPCSWQKNGKVSDEAGPKPGKLHLQAAVNAGQDERLSLGELRVQQGALNSDSLQGVSFLLTSGFQRVTKHWTKQSLIRRSICTIAVTNGLAILPWLDITGILTTRCHWRRAVAYVSYLFEKKYNFL